MRFNKRFWFILLLLGVAACSTWSTTTVKPAKADTLVQASAPADPGPAGPAGATVSPPTSVAADGMVLTENDITDRPYKVLGDIKVSVNKTTILNKDPTHADVDAKLRKAATKLGADAVVLVRYGTVGIGLMSWGTLSGQGRAIKFQ